MGQRPGHCKARNETDEKEQGESALPLRGGQRGRSAVRDLELPTDFADEPDIDIIRLENLQFRTA